MESSNTNLTITMFQASFLLCQLHNFALHQAIKILAYHSLHDQTISCVKVSNITAGQQFIREPSIYHLLKLPMQLWERANALSKKPQHLFPRTTSNLFEGVVVGLEGLLMIMPAVKFYKSVVDSDGHAPAAAGLPRRALPPRLHSPSQLLDEPIVPPRYYRVAKLCRSKHYGV